MGDALLKQVTPKSGSNSLVAVYWGERSATSSDYPAYKTRYSCDSDYFTYADYVFTAQKSFNATVKVIGRGCISSSGSTVYCNYTLYHNGTSIASGQFSNSNNDVGASVSVSFAAQDTLEIKAYGSTTTGVSAGFYVEVV